MRSVRIWICFAICFLVFELALAKKEDKSFKDGPTTGMTQYVDLVKYIYKHALSKGKIKIQFSYQKFTKLCFITESFY